MKATEIKEGKARLLVPEKSLTDPHHCEVFFNPAMRFNRSVSSVALGACLPLLDGAVVLDGLSATGVRGVRYALENKVDKIIFVEANPKAVALLKKNIKLNKLTRKANVIDEDFSVALAKSEERFDFVEIDPFGSPVFFLEPAIRRLKKKAVLSVTATDLAKLAGTFSKTCVRQYAAKPAQTPYRHEIALRILLGRIAQVAAQHDYGFTPLLSFYSQHFVKVFVFLDKGAAKADESLKQTGFGFHCFKCGQHFHGRGVKETCVCHGRLEWFGPVWLGKLNDNAFLRECLTLNAKRKLEDEKQVAKLLGLLLEENDLPPFFFDLHRLCEMEGKTAVPNDVVLDKLRKKGFKAARTHFTGTGIKTNASISDVVGCL